MSSLSDVTFSRALGTPSRLSAKRPNSTRTPWKAMGDPRREGRWRSTVSPYWPARECSVPEWRQWGRVGVMVGEGRFLA